jgi:hypothetical protein
MLLAAAAPPAPLVCVAPTSAERLAAAATVMLPLVPLTVLLDELEMLGLQPASTIGGVTTPATHIAMVNNAIHLFIRIVLYRFGRLGVRCVDALTLEPLGAVGEPGRRSAIPLARQHRTAARARARHADRPPRPALHNESS